MQTVKLPPPDADFTFTRHVPAAPL